MTVIETERLILSHLTPECDAFIFELLNNPTWLEFIGDRGIKNLEDARNYILNGPQLSYETNGFGLYLVKLKTDETPIGLCGLIHRDYLEYVDIGYALLPEYTGKGYAFEAGKATLDYAKNVLKIHPVAAITTEDNSHSIALLKKLGLKFDKKVRFSPNDNEKDELLLFIN
ncbi:Protein N-acetyltransferase, RimJ/RimL family [Pseudarcicella hirudinis]|uniref:Protein N-acetyltransferase, RimJ/RimL family n=1 Tax=Pseudarcicella hirudinis TaxID=1079859 RepID=A0A1I5SV81_9BACT|nr:GNAT family N-acetyltransferase [Pseudarcicella hirudinis]SFP74598.1 Protein N-acetyltransferase, RimJ/RimL family [Pseudarcicella hirudinis]